MKKLWLFVIASLLLPFAVQVLPTHAQSCVTTGRWYAASLNADIDPGAADFLAGAVSSAEAACAQHFVLILTTNGGDGGSMESMVASIKDFESYLSGNTTTFITLIAPSGGFAFSAGAYVSEASNEIYMVPGTTIGSATPIVSGIPTGEENTTLTKDINAFASYMETLTESNGRNSTATGLMVTQGKSFTCSLVRDCQALRDNVVNGVLNASTTRGALALLGVPPSTSVATPGIRSMLISIFSDPNVSSLLFLIGIFAVLFDIYHPTIVLSVVGVIVVALSLFGLGLFGASPLAVLLMVVGAAFIFLEAKTAHGVSAAIGVVIFAIGFLFMVQNPPGQLPTSSGATFAGTPDITYGLLVALGVAVVIGSLYLRRIRQGLMGKPKVFDSSGTVGRIGIMHSDLVPNAKGVVLIGAEEWSATSVQYLKRGDQVRVKAVDGLELIVEKVQS